MSDSDDSYGPPLPPGMDSKKDDSDSSDDQYGPPLPKKSKSSDENIIGPTIPPVKGGNCDKYSSDSESDSSSSDSSDSDNDRKKRKKKKRKSKKSDYNKEKSDVSKDSKSFIGPFIPSNLTKCENDVPHKSIGPALPPELAQYSDKNSSRQTNVPGNSDDDDDDDYGIGPSVNLQASEQDCSAVLEFEGRSQKMLQKLTSTAEPEKEQPIQRESWMTELPDQIGVNFGLSNRQFRAKAAPEQDHSWTKTPQEKEEKSKDGKKKKKYESLEQDKNEKASKEIEEYNKKHRPKSLLEMHQKKLEKKKKKEKKKNKDKKPERRPFDRDLDLKANRLDEAQRKAFIKRSQDLGSRFKTGGTGTSFM